MSTIADVAFITGPERAEATAAYLADPDLSRLAGAWFAMIERRGYSYNNACALVVEALADAVEELGRTAADVDDEPLMPVVNRTRRHLRAIPAR